jgi:hypothetical protein
MIDAMLGIGISLGNRFMGEERLDEFTLITHTLRSTQIPEIIIRWAKGRRPQAVTAKVGWDVQVRPRIGGDWHRFGGRRDHPSRLRGFPGSRRTGGGADSFLVKFVRRTIFRLSIRASVQTRMAVR